MLPVLFSAWKSDLLPFLAFFWARTLPLIFPITIGVYEQKILGSVRSFSGPRTEKFPLWAPQFQWRILMAICQLQICQKKQKTGLSNTNQFRIFICWYHWQHTELPISISSMTTLATGLSYSLLDPTSGKSQKNLAGLVGLTHKLAC